MAFNACPIEVNALIAMELSDQDIGNYRLVCQATYNAVEDSHQYFWRQRFLSSFDPTQPLLNAAAMKSLYQNRRKWQRKAPRFANGSSRNEKHALETIKDLIIDSKPATDVDGVPCSLNLQVLDHLIVNTNLLDCIMGRHNGKGNDKPASRLLMVVQLALSARSICFMKQFKLWSFPDSQRAAYLPAATANLFVDSAKLQVNVEWTLHLVNFFRHHMLAEIEQTLVDAYKFMDEKSKGLDLPQYWKGQLTDNDCHTPLGQNWKGTYAYLDRPDVARLRHYPTSTSEVVFPDHNVDLGENAIQDMKITFPAPGSEAPWPQLFERHLSSLQQTWRRTAASPPATKTRAQHRRGNAPAGISYPSHLPDRRFEGKGFDDEEFYASGWINPLPPQEGIPGWKRMTMMKYFLDSNGQFDVDALWCYEGVVLPGGQIIVGRWWAADDHTPAADIYCGPFILWNTDCFENFKVRRPAEAILLEKAAREAQAARAQAQLALNRNRH